MNNREQLPPIINGVLSCANCKKEFFQHNKSCPSCGWINPHHLTDDERQKKAKEQELKAKELEVEIQMAKETGDWSKISPQIFEQESSRVILTTSFLLANKNIQREIEIVTAECVFGLNIFKDVLAGMSDFFGGRSKTTQEALRKARKTVLAELRKEALTVGADAVIGIDLDYSEFSGQGKSMLFLVASGTAVKIENGILP